MDTTDTSRPAETGNSLKEFVGILLSLSAFLTALFYFTGHAFMVNFFQEMNIPSNLLTMSLWEYGEVGWRYFVIYLFWAAVLVFVGAVAVGLMVVAVSFLREWGRKHSFHTRVKFFKKRSQLQLSSASRGLVDRVLGTLRLLSVIIVIFIGVTFVIYAAGQDAGRGGMTAGREAILNAQLLTIVTDYPLDIPGGTKIETPEKNTLYRYDNLYLLTYNEDRYFAYRTLGAEMCRPNEVYIIAAENIRQSVLSVRPANAPGCP